MPRSKTEKKLSLLLGGLSLALTGLLSFLSPSHSRQRESEEEKSKAAKYELREADAKGLMHVGMSLFFGAILMHLGLTSAFFQLRRHSGESPQTLSNLKGHPTFTQDFQSYLKNEEHLLSSYDWIDRKNEKVRIPIRRAIDLMVEQSGATP